MQRFSSADAVSPCDRRFRTIDVHWRRAHRVGRPAEIAAWVEVGRLSTVPLVACRRFSRRNVASTKPHLFDAGRMTTLPPHDCKDLLPLRLLGRFPAGTGPLRPVLRLFGPGLKVDVSHALRPRTQFSPVAHATGGQLCLCRRLRSQDGYGSRTKIERVHANLLALEAEARAGVAPRRPP